jgi:hypothetical protein
MLAGDDALETRFRHKSGGNVALASMHAALRRAAKRAGYTSPITMGSTVDAIV